MIHDNKKRIRITLFSILGILVLLFLTQRHPMQANSNTTLVTKADAKIESKRHIMLNNNASANVTSAATLNRLKYKKTVIPVVQQSSHSTQLTAYLASEHAGIIGVYDGKQLDNPADNIFTVKLDYLPTLNDKVWLNYSLTGLDDNSNVACSVNDRQSFGGYLVKKNAETKRQRVQINTAWLQKGENRIQFGLPENVDYGYKISDLAIEVERGTNESPLAVNAGYSLYNSKAYIHGFIQELSSNTATVTIDGKAVSVRDGEFETIIMANDKLETEIQAQIKGKLYSKTIRFKRNTEPDKEFALQSSIPTTAKTFIKGYANTLQTTEAQLKVSDKALLATQRMSLTTLRNMDLPALDMGMTNVTQQSKGFRFLPHGEHFTNGATVALKYDRSKIPDGYTENDIKTFYFDTNSKHWVALERDTIDKALCMVVSKTTHFTDMINGVIKAPESPETQGFAPTMMNNIKAADPTAKIELIAPPTANSQGSANLSYQLELPPARNGISPQLAIQYNSDGGSGWLGEGWDLNIPSITVDTKFGVPVFDKDSFETETYSLNGIQLARSYIPLDVNNNEQDVSGTMFLPDRGVVYLRNKPIYDANGKLKDKNEQYQFYPRIETNFPLIIRYGTEIDKYRWLVNDKSGVKYYYGYNGATLDDGHSKIGEWKLQSMVDIHGDSVAYSYNKTDESGYGTLRPKAIYLSEIEVFNKDIAGYKKHTEIHFICNKSKTKLVNNARYGFLVSNQKLLEKIEVWYANANDVMEKVRSYAFTYSQGKLLTDLLGSVSQLDSTDKVIIGTHKFNYYDDVVESGDNYVSSNASTVSYSNLNSSYGNCVASSITAALSGGQAAFNINKYGLLNNSISNSVGGALYLGIGLGINVASKVATIGVNKSFNTTTTKGKSMLIDINGDGILDNVFEQNNRLYFNKGLSSSGFDSRARALVNAPNYFSKSVTENVAIGVWGDAGVISGRLDKDLMNKTTTSTYISDVNGDGLPDIISDENVYFNYLTYDSDGTAIPNFSRNSNLTTSPMTNKTVYNTTPSAAGVMRYDKTADDEIKAGASPLQDIVRVWEAPYSGNINVSGGIKLLPPSGVYDTLAYQYADGVRVAIQHEKTELWFNKISKGNTDKIVTTNLNLTVKAGDRLFFRVQSGDSLLSNGEFDKVAWNPKISYKDSVFISDWGPKWPVYGSDNKTVLNGKYLSLDNGGFIHTWGPNYPLYDNNNNIVNGYYPKDASGYNTYNFTASEGNLVNKTGFNIINQIISPAKIEGTFTKPITGYPVTLSVYASNHESNIQDNSDPNLPPICYTDYNYINVGSITFDANKKCTDESFNMSSDSKYRYYWFKLSSTGSVKWDSIKCYPKIHYQFLKDDIATNDTVNAGVKYETKTTTDKLNNSTYTLKNNFTSNPNKPAFLVVPGIGGKDYKFKLVLFRKNAQGIIEFNNNINLTCVDGNAVVYVRRSINNSTSTFTSPYTNWSSNISSNTQNLGYDGQSPIINVESSEIYLNNDYYPGWNYTYQVYADNGNTYLIDSKVYIKDRYEPIEDFKFGPMWRGWGQFEYNADNGRYARPIVVDSIMPDINKNDTARLFFKNMYNIPLAPDFRTKHFWQGFSDNICILGDTMCAGRINQSETVNLKAFFNPNGRYRSKAAFDQNEIYYINAPNIINKQQNQSGSLSLSLIPASISQNLGVSFTSGKGTYEKILDYIDMNGDGFPDYFKEGKILYSNSRGSVSSKTKPCYSEIENGKTSTFGVGISGGLTVQNSPTSSATAKSNELAGSCGLSVSFSKNTNELNVSYVDINGDGLPDKIYHQDNKVAINLGYTFSDPVDLTVYKNDMTTLSANAGLGIGINIDNGSIQAGFGIGAAVSSTNKKLLDINGDGLLDIVSTDLIEDKTDLNLMSLLLRPISVYLNTGNGFSKLNTTYFNNLKLENTLATSYSANAAATFGFTLLFLKFVCNPTGNLSTTNSRILDDIRDFDGDGFPDFLSTDLANSKLNIQYSTIKRTNKLKTIENPLGGKSTLDYERSVRTSDHPGGKWVMKSVVTTDGIDDDGDNIRTEFEYADGKYNRRERQFDGFGTVTTINMDNETPYRKTIQTFDTRNCYVKGNLLSTVLTDGQGKKYLETQNTYYNYNVFVRRQFKYNAQEDKNDVYDCYWYDNKDDISLLTDNMVVYSPLKYTTTIKYETNNSSGLSNQSFYTYWTDKKDYTNYMGDLKSYRYSDKGSLTLSDTTQYNYKTTIAYKSEMTTKSFVAGLPTDVTVNDNNGKTFRHYRAYYKDRSFPTHLTNLTHYLSAHDSLSTRYDYDKWGNVAHEILPSKMSYTYTYDNRYNMYITQVKDTLGYVSKMEDYDYRYGIPRKTTDINGNVMTTEIDNLGRVTKIKGPNESDYTLKFEYYPLSKDAQGKNSPYAITKHYDPENPTNDLETYTFVDGFGRAIQVKKDGVIDGQEKMIVSGRAKYDAFGRVIETFYPIVEGTDKKASFNPAFDGTTPTKTTYDILDRAIKTVLPDGNTTQMSFSIEGGNLKTTITDALNHSQETYTNGSSETVKTQQHLGNEAITTLFEYDPINQLTMVTDAKGGQTKSEYDMAGRLTQVTHPASGVTKFKYDDATGNLIEKRTANLDITGMPIKYQYDFNRLKEINYPNHPENDVKYVYGTKDEAGEQNAYRAGRLKYQEDGSGGQEFKYGKMGELTEVRRTMVIPNQAVATYVTGWKYDCWNRVQTMTYPDGEVLNYAYNTAGLLTGVTGTKGGYTYPYVKNIGYDKFEQRATMQYGNGANGDGAITTYTYYPLNRQLSNLQVLANNNTIMSNAYLYDEVSNVKTVTNTGTSANGIGGGMVHNYYYDDLYRLQSASGTFTGANGKTASYTLGMGYDNLHNITRKNQTMEQTGVQFDGLLKAGYNLSYQYADNPQQISNIADSSYRYADGESHEPILKTQQYSYDANGNMLCIITGTKTTDGKLQASNSRKMLWDEENRLLALSDNGFVSNYWYDAAGERTVKTSGDGEGLYVNGLLSGARTGTTNFTAYVSPYTVVGNGGQMSKHIYMGSQRIVSKLCNSGTMTDPTAEIKAGAKDFTAKYALQTGNIKVRYDSLGVTYRGKDNAGVGFYTAANSTDKENLQYFYHSDYLGSSSLITDIDGNVAQHIEYIPFGEVFVEERNNSWKTPYKFNGKELDEETGLYYYGARYMDPRTSVWLSVDPLTEKYPGVGSYIYCNNNPINLVDPDGRAWDSNQWSPVKWYSVNRLYIGYSHEHFFSNGSYKSAVNAVNSMYKNSSQFKSAWNDIKSSKSTFSINEVVPLRDQNGDIIEGGSQLGSTINIAQGRINKNTIFEEVFHAAQGEYYNTNSIGMTTSKAIAIEVEAKIAAAASGIDNGFGTALTGSLSQYVAAIKNGTPISSELRQGVNSQLKSYAEKLVAPQNENGTGGLGYEKLKDGLKDFNPSTALKYFENNIKKENK